MPTGEKTTETVVTTTSESGETTTVKTVETTTPKAGDETSTTTAPSDESSTPKTGETTTPKEGTETTTTSGSSSDQDTTVAYTTTVIPTTVAPEQNCSWDCKCFVTCQNQKHGSGLPSRCGSEEVAECDLCMCEDGWVKDPVTRKCVLQETGCERQSSYDGKSYGEGEEFWKGDCIKCQCRDGREYCESGLCRITQDDCDERGQRFIDVPGSCCFCAPYNITITTPEPVTTPEMTTKIPVVSTTIIGGGSTTTKDIIMTGVITSTKSVSTTTAPKTCNFNGTDYTGKKVWSPDSCHSCRCVQGEAECAKICTITSCPDGHVLDMKEGSDECCKCVPQMCEYEGTYKEFGETWELDECVTCECVDASTGVTCKNEKSSCNTNCLEGEELQYVEGQCCPICVARPLVDESCAPITISTMLNIDGCVSDEEIELNACNGRCASNVTMIQEPPFVQTNCHCCKPAEVEHRTVTLTCLDGSKSEHAVPYTTACSCTDCESNVYFNSAERDNNGKR